MILFLYASQRCSTPKTNLPALFFHLLRGLTWLFILMFAVPSLAIPAGRHAFREVHWGSTGHRLINLKAAMHLPASMSAIRADSSFYGSHASDADGRKVYSDTSFYAEAERHYMDIEDYPNFHSIPHNLDSVMQIYGRTFVHNTGTQPWAEVMVMDSLTAQFRRGDMTAAKQSMADLGHYVGDAHQPLHITNNFDGQKTGNNGIHSRYETSMINTYQSSLIITQDTAQYIASPIDYIFEFLYQSNSYMDSIMAADNYAKSVSGWSGSGTAPTAYYTALWQKCGDFTKLRFQHATVALASLWYTAWVNSQTVNTITATSSANGTITPSGVVTKAPGTSQRFIFTPSPGYKVDSVMIDGVTIDSIAGYTFSNILTNHTIYVSFVYNTDRFILASSGAHGTITPSGNVMVTLGTDQRFTFAPATGYHLDSVIVDGSPVDSVDGYTFSNIDTNHTIAVRYAINTFLITSGTSGNGTISPALDVLVPYGSNHIFIATPDPGYQIDSIFVDEIYAGTSSPDTIMNVTAPHTIRCTFVPAKFTLHIGMAKSWNLVSVPFYGDNLAAVTLFPAATSAAYAYTGTYVSQGILHKGPGYWLKFGVAQDAPILGYPVSSDTIVVTAGWNLIGSVRTSISTNSIIAMTPGLTLSSFFGYSHGYTVADTIRPGCGYWVKSNMNGEIVLGTSPGAQVRDSRLTLQLFGEMPPLPPAFEQTLLMPADFGLSQNYPNPFNPSTVINYSLPTAGYVSLKIYNTLGEEIATLVDGNQDPGYKAVRFENSTIPSGVYMYRLATGGFSEMKKMVLLR